MSTSPTQPETNKVVDKGKTVAGVAGYVTGTAAGSASSVAAISAAGTVAGLSGPGIATGLAAIGGTMLGGIGLIVLFVGATGYGGAKLGQWIYNEFKNA